MILKGDMYSNVLEMETKITVLAPDNYMSVGKMKVVYLLHGLCGRSGDLIDYTMLPTYAKLHDIIFVMPDVGRSFYTDMRYGQKYFSYVVDELPHIVEKIFNISSSRMDTIVMGVSMGGYGALKCALRRPDKYGLCLAFSSPCLFLEEGLNNHRKNCDNPDFINMIGEQLIRDFYGIFGESIEYNPEDDVNHMIDTFENKAEKPKIYISCGKEDMFIHDNKRMAEKILSKGFDIKFESWSGNHDWIFFNESIRRGLEYIKENTK